MLAVSSDAQAETLPHQQRMAEQTAEAKGWRLERVLGAGREGVGSGKSGPRAIVVRLIAELTAVPKEQRPAWVWMRRVDRTGRGRAAESLVALHEIADLGVRIWDHDSGEVRLDTAEGEIIAGLKAGLARLENEVRAGKARAGNDRRRQAGKPIGNRRPYGLTNGPDGFDVVVEEQAAAVRMAFAMRLEGHGYKTISLRMIAIAPPQNFRRRPEARSIAWSPQAVRRLLGTRAYIGTVIDEFTFRRAQQIRESLTTRFPSRARKHPWPLAGALRCPCGMGLVGVTGGGSRPDRSRKFRYYVCRKIVNHAGRTQNHRADHIEEQFRALLADLDASPQLIAQYRRANVPTTSPALLRQTLRAARAELATLEQRRIRVWEMNEAGHVRNEDVQVRLDELSAARDGLNEQVAAIEMQLAAAESSATTLADSAAVIALAAKTFDDAEDADQRRIAREVGAVLGGLYVGPDHLLRAARSAALAK